MVFMFETVVGHGDSLWKRIDTEHREIPLAVDLHGVNAVYDNSDANPGILRSDISFKTLLYLGISPFSYHFIAGVVNKIPLGANPA